MVRLSEVGEGCGSVRVLDVDINMIQGVLPSCSTLYMLVEHREYSL